MTDARCELCGEPMPEGETMFKYHGYSGPCPKPPMRAAQPAEPVAWMKTTPRTTYLRTAECMADTPEECDGLNRYGWTPLYAAPPAPVPPDPAAEMDAVAIRYAHKMALDLECILAEYGGSWYNTAMQTLGEYRSAMNAIHERESPTFMGEPVTAAGDKT